MSAVRSTMPATSADAVAHFSTRLAFETDVRDVHAGLHAAVEGLIVIDSRSRKSWDQGHIPGAVHLPTDQITARAPGLIGADAMVVTYCWGTGLQRRGPRSPRLRAPRIPGQGDDRRLRILGT